MRTALWVNAVVHHLHQGVKRKRVLQHRPTFGGVHFHNLQICRPRNVFHCFPQARRLDTCRQQEYTLFFSHCDTRRFCVFDGGAHRLCVFHATLHEQANATPLNTSLLVVLNRRLRASVGIHFSKALTGATFFYPSPLLRLLSERRLTRPTNPQPLALSLAYPRAAPARGSPPEESSASAPRCPCPSHARHCPRAQGASPPARA